MANIKGMLNRIRKNTGSASFLNSKYGKVNNWISTGSFALNRILSGSINKGFPSGRVVVLAGENSVGKSLIAAYCSSNALKEGYDHIFYFDAEGGALKEFFENVGCDPDKIEHLPVENLDDAQLQILDVYNEIKALKAEEDIENEKYKDQPDKQSHSKFLCILDSIGALVDDKVFKDADKGKVTSDMGSTAKLKNRLMKAITIPALKADTTMMVLNHVYDDPSAMFSSKIKTQGGGKGLAYMCSVNVQCSRNLEKDEDAKKTGDSFHSGTNLTFFTIKNRMCRPSLECKIYLDFKHGFVNKYDGLFEDALKYGFILNPKQGFYSIPSYSDPEKCFRRNQIESNETIWNTFIEQFDIKSMEDLKYSSEARKAIEEDKDENDLELDSIEEQIEVQ